MTRVINLGGEGELAGAINLNLMSKDMMTNTRFGDSATLVIQSSAHQMAIGTSSVDLVVANRFPIQYDEVVIHESGSRAPISDLAGEIVRILKPGGVLRFNCSSCDEASLIDALMTAGLANVSVENRTIRGVRP